MGTRAPAIESPDGTFISAAAAIRSYPGMNRAKLYHLGLTGRIRVKLLPGIPPRYSAEDLDQVQGQMAAHAVGA